MDEVMVYVEATGKAVQLSYDGQVLELPYDKAVFLVEKLFKVLGLKMKSPEAKKPVQPVQNEDGDFEYPEAVSAEDPDEAQVEGPEYEYPEPKPEPQPKRKAPSGKSEASSELIERARRLGQKR